MKFFRTGASTFLIAASCASGPPQSTASASPVAATWQLGLADLQAAGAAIYSFRFDGPPPEGAFYTLAIHATSAEAACARYGADGGAADDDFWLLETTVNDGSTGDHKIVLAPRSGTPSATANVTLLHRKQGAFVESYDAVGGTVSLTSNPSPAEAAGGTPLTGRIDAEFPADAVQLVGCEGGQPADGGPAVSWCTCRHAADGGLSTCVPATVDNCCPDPSGPLVRASIAFTATGCASMCRWAAGLSADYCFQFFGQ